MEALINIERVAELLGIRISTVRYYCHKRMIPHQKIGHRVLFRQSELEQWLEAGQRPVVDSSAECLVG